MKIYIAIDLILSQIIGSYTTKALAETKIKELIRKYPNRKDDYTIKETTLDH